MGTNVENDYNEIERNYFNYLGIGRDLIPMRESESFRDQSLYHIESQLSEVNSNIDRIEKNMNFLQRRFGQLEERIVTMDYIDYKIEELNEWLEEEYSLLFDDLSILKKYFTQFVDKM